MTPYVVYAVAYVAATAVSVLVGIAALRGRPAPGALGLATLAFAQAQWSGSLALQWIFTDHGPSLVWLTVRNIGLFITPIAILMLVMSYVGKERWLSPHRIAVASAIPLLAWLSIPSDPWHGLYLAGTEPAMKVNQGGPIMALAFIYSYGLIVFAASVLVVHLFKRSPYPKQATVLLIAVLLPFFHFTAQFAGIDLFPDVNSVPFTFTVSGALMWFALIRLGLFRLVPVARDQLIEQLPMGVVVFDAEGRIIDFNPTAVRMTGASSPIIGKTSAEAFPLQIDTVSRLREGLLADDTVTVRAEFSPGLWVEAVASALRDRAGERIAILVTLRDVGEQRAAERMQRDFVANVAHELKTPLTGLSLLAKTIPRAMRNDPQAVDGFVSSLDSQIDRLVHMTDELMALSRADALPRSASAERTDLSAVVAEQVAAMQHLAESSHQAIVTLVPNGLEVACDARSAGTMLGNLLGNAIRYTDADGTITISAKRHVDSTDAEWIRISVADDGDGIPPEHQERIFERFYRVDRARSRRTGGAGLGLSIVKQLAEACGGTVTVKSAPDEGSTFTLHLPAA